MAWAYIFMKVELQKGGLVKGEARAAGYEGQIEVDSFGWGGLEARDAFKGTRPKGAKFVIVKVEGSELSIRKRVDSASPALLRALHTKDRITRATLTVVAQAGEAGKGAAEMFSIAISDARVKQVSVDVSESEKEVTLSEDVTFAFDAVQVKYTTVMRAGQTARAPDFSYQFSHE